MSNGHQPGHGGRNHIKNIEATNMYRRNTATIETKTRNGKGDSLRKSLVMLQKPIFRNGNLPCLSLVRNPGKHAAASL